MIESLTPPGPEINGNGGGGGSCRAPPDAPEAGLWAEAQASTEQTAAAITVQPTINSLWMYDL